MIKYSLHKLRRLISLLLLLLSIALIVYSIGGRALITLVPSNKPFILNQMARAIGSEVRASAIEAGWSGFAPWVRIRDFEVVTASGLVAINIDLIEFNVHLGYSLMVASPAAGVLRITGADLQLVQHQHGGFGLKGGQGNIAIDLKPLLDFALDSGSLSVSNSRIRLDSKLSQLSDRLFDLMVDVKVVTTSPWKNLQARVTDLANGQGNLEPTQLIIEGTFQGDVSDLASMSADIHLRANTLNSEHWLNSLQVVSSQLVFAADDLAANIRLRPDHRMNVWFNCENLRGHMASSSGEIMPIAIAASSVSLQRESADTWGIQIATEHGKVGKISLKPIIFKAAVTKQDDVRQYWLTSSELSFKPIKDVLLFEQKLPANVRRWLTKIRPEALLKNVYSQIKHISGEPLQFAATMDLESIQAQAFNAIPYLDGLQGKLLAFESGGLFKVDAESFRVAFPNLVDPVLPVDKARFDLLFAFEPDAFFIRADNINVASPYGDLTGGFSVHNPQSVHLRTLSVQLAFGNTNLDTFLELLPKRLPVDFKNWLRGAVLDGKLIHGGAIYHSHLLPHEPLDVSSLGLILDVQSVGFDYDPEWPQINQSQGRVHVTETGTHIFLTAAQMFGLKLNNIDVFAPVTSTAVQPIRIFGKTAGQLSQMVDFIRRTPAREFVDPSVLAWRITGEGEFDIDLDLAIDSSEESSLSDNKVVAILDGNIAQARLDIKELDLTFANSQGHLRIDSDNGVFSEGIDFDVFGGRAHARMWSDWNEVDNEKLYMELNGIADIKTLAKWMDFPGLRLMTGQFQYSGDAAIVMTPAMPIEMWLSSDLVGLDIPLPMPFTKTLVEGRPTVLNFAIDEQGVIDVKLGIEPGIRALLELADGEVTRGILQLNNEIPLVLPTEPVGLEVYGHIDSTDFGRWLDSIDAIDVAYAQYSSDGASAAPEVLHSIAVAGDSMTVGEFEITDFKLQMNRDKPKQLWLAKIESVEAIGDFKIYDDDTKPVLAHLRQVSVTYEDEKEKEKEPLQQTKPSANSADAASSDPLAGIDFEDLVAMKVQIDKLQIDEEDYGSWSFNMKPMAGSVEFSSLSANIRGLILGETTPLSTQTSAKNSVISAAQGVPARLIWNRTVNGDVSRYVGNASAGNLGEIMSSWEYPSSLVTKAAYMDVDVKWPGSPAMFDWLAARGQTELNFHRGGVTGIDKDVSAITRVISLLDASFWIRRLYLDFADLQAEGVVFDRLHGTIFLEAGVVRVGEPVRMKGPGADLSFTGSVNMINEELDGELVATLPLSKNLPWLAAYLALYSNPITGAITFLAERIFRKRIERLSSAKYVVKGTIEDPDIVLAKVFNVGLEKGGSDSEKQAPANSSPIEVVSPTP